MALRQHRWIPVFQPIFDRGSVVSAHPQPCMSLLAAGTPPASCDLGCPRHPHVTQHPGVLLLPCSPSQFFFQSIS